MNDFVLVENGDFLIVHKKPGIPCGPLAQGDNCMISLLSKKYPEILKVENSFKAIEGGLCHRIDTQTEGIVLVARNTEFWNHIQQAQKNNRFKKTYVAVCQKNLDNAEKLGGFPSHDFTLEKNLIIKSHFRNYGKGHKSVRPVLFETSSRFSKEKAFDKMYETRVINFCKKKDDSALEKYEFTCRINSGFRHQVRCHLAWIGYPVIGDDIYNSSKSEGKMMFFATEIEFPDIHTKKSVVYDFSNEIKRTCDQ